MEAGGVSDSIRVVGEIEAAVAQGVVEVVDPLEMPVGERFADQGPEVFGRLQFGGIGWKEFQPNPVRDHAARNQTTSPVAGRTKP